MGLTYVVRAFVSDGANGVLETDLSADVSDLRFDAPGWTDGPVAPAARCRFNLRDVGGVRRGSALGSLPDGAGIIVEAYTGRDTFDTADPLVAERLDGREVAGGFTWERTGLGVGFEAGNGEVRSLSGRGRPAGSRVFLDAGAEGMPLILSFLRVSNGLGGFNVGGSSTSYYRIRFLDAETHLEFVNASRGRPAFRTASTGDPVPENEWRRYEALWEGRSFTLRVNEPGELLAREVLRATNLVRDATRVRVGLEAGFRNTVDRWGDFGIGRRVFTGRVYRPTWELGGDVMSVDCWDDSERWRRRRVTSGFAFHVTPRTVGGTFDLVAFTAGLPLGSYQARDSAEVIRSGTPLVFNSVEAGDALTSLARESFAHVVVDGGGILRLDGRGRWLRELALAADSDAANSPVALDSSKVRLVGGQVAGETDQVERQVRLVVRRPVNTGRQIIWSGADTLAIPAGSFRNVPYLLAGTGRYYASAVQLSAGSLVANTMRDGSGVDVAATVTAIVTNQGGGGVVRFTNIGTATAYVLSWDLIAGAAWREGNPLEGVATLEVEGRDVLIQARFVDLFSVAGRIAAERLAVTGRARSAYTLQFLDADGALGTVLLRLQIGQGVKVVDLGAWGFSGAFIVEAMTLADGVWSLRLREG